MPPVPIPLHVSCYWSSEGVSFLSGDIYGDGDVPQVGPVSIFLPPLSPKVCRVPGVKATPLDWRSRGGTTSGGSCPASLTWSRLEPIVSVEILFLIGGKINSFHMLVPVGPDLEPLHIALEWLLDSWWRALFHGLQYQPGGPAPVISSASSPRWHLFQPQLSGWRGQELVLAAGTESSVHFMKLSGAPA